MMPGRQEDVGLKRGGEVPEGKKVILLLSKYRTEP